VCPEMVNNIISLRHLNGSALKIASSKRKMLCAGKGISGLFYDVVEKLLSTVIESSSLKS